MKPLKILILITKANWGGAQRFVYDLATGLPKERFSVEVMAGDEGPLTDKLSAAGIYASGTLELGRDVNVSGDLKGFFRLISLLRSKRPDVLHLNSSKIGGLGALAGRIARVPKIIFTVHGWAFNESRPIHQKAVIAFLYWFTMLLSDEVIVVSQAAREQVRSWPWIQKKITVIHNGIGSAGASFAKANSRLELARMNEGLRKAVEGVSEHNLVWLGTVAELHPVKGHSYALKAVAECVKSLERSDPGKKLIYTVIGAGREKDRLAFLLRDLGLEGKVFLMGHIDNVAQYIKAFDVFLLASISEALGYVLLEAGAAGLPVVATSVGGIPEVIDDMRSGILVQPKNARDLAHALSFMIEHPRESREYGSKLKEKVTAEFSLAKMLEAIERIYTK